MAATPYIPLTILLTVFTVIVKKLSPYAWEIFLKIFRKDMDNFSE